MFAHPIAALPRFADRDHRQPIRTGDLQDLNMPEHGLTVVTSPRRKIDRPEGPTDRDFGDFLEENHPDFPFSSCV